MSRKNTPVFSDFFACSNIFPEVVDAQASCISSCSIKIVFDTYLEISSNCILLSSQT